MQIVNNYGTAVEKSKIEGGVHIVNHVTNPVAPAPGTTDFSGLAPELDQSHLAAKKIALEAEHDAAAGTTALVETAANCTFISHSSHDADAARALVAALEAQDISCWIAPRNVPPASQYSEAIIDGINACSLFVLLLSGHSNASHQVFAEVERAASKGRRILTIRLETVTLAKRLEYFLSSYQHFDAFPPLEAHLSRLVEAVGQSISAKTQALLEAPSTQASSLAREVTDRPSALEVLPADTHPKVISTPSSPTAPPTLTGASPGLTFQQAFADIAKEIDEQWPYPIAHCFRTVSHEKNAAQQWQRMLLLHEMTLKYIAICLLASLDDADCLTSELRKALLVPALGHWNHLCFALPKLAAAQPDNFLQGYLDALGKDPKLVKRARGASDRLVEARNDTKGHGFISQDTQYRYLAQSHAGDLRSFLNLAALMARYTLMKPFKMEVRRGKSKYEALVMMGSHPDFPAATYETTGQVETDCLLRAPESGRLLNLYPWLFVDECSECRRDRLFLYDHTEEKGIIVREYPDNHTRRGDPEQTQAVQEWIELRAS